MRRAASIGICDICQEQSSSLHQLTDDALIFVAEASGLQADFDFCDRCYRVLQGKLTALEGSQTSLGRSPTLQTIDGSIIPSQDAPRLSEMPLPSSPSRSRTSSSQQSGLDDTVDRMVNRKRRVDKSIAAGIASQSLSIDRVSSQDVSASQQRHPVTVYSQDSSLESVPLAPLPKKPRIRPAAKQFATGRLDLPSTVKARILPDDMPRATSG